MSERSVRDLPRSIASTRGLRLLVILGCVQLLGADPASGQLPDEFSNLQVLPQDITRDSLVQIMRGFSFALGVRCQYCHTGGDGISFEGVEFDSDDDPNKQKARFMLRMVEQLNGEILPQMASRDEPPLEMGCKNCHRGQPKPELLQQTLRRVLDASGADAMVSQYRRLRETQSMAGAFDFGEWETNVLADRLAREDRVGDAIRVYTLNAEFYPESVSIAFALGQLHERAGDPDAAVKSYRRVLELNSEHAGAIARLAEIGAS